jgi:hypothetical protein
MKQLILGIGNAIWWVIEPHCSKVCLTRGLFATFLVKNNAFLQLQRTLKVVDVTRKMKERVALKNDK